MSKRLTKIANISGQEILAMLNQKGICLMQLANQHRFTMTDIMDVINAKRAYPNIARVIAESLNATPYLLWPCIYQPDFEPSTSIFVLRVTLS